jgi:hypothetical protein
MNVARRCYLKAMSGRANVSSAPDVNMTGPSVYPIANYRMSMPKVLPLLSLTIVRRMCFTQV